VDNSSMLYGILGWQNGLFEDIFEIYKVGVGRI
jgi:hypothetical protein